MHPQSGKPSFIASLSEHVAAIWIDLDGADRDMAEDEIGEQSAAGPCEQVKRSHVMPAPQASAKPLPPG